MSEYDRPITQLILNQTVTLRVHKSRKELTIAMMKKMKCQRNRLRKGLGLPVLPKMDWTITELSPEQISIEFKLRYGINL